MRRDSGNQLLEELEQLSHTLYPTTRRTASLALPRDSSTSSLPPPSTSKPRSRRMSLSPWRSRPNHETSSSTDQLHHHDDDDVTSTTTTTPPVNNKKRAIWNWKPIRALTHIGMQKLSCLFSIDVVTAQGLPPSMNGLRLSVCVRKKENKDGAVHTMPSRVSQGAADFEETLFFRCHVYCTTSGTAAKHLKFEPRPFLIYLFAVDAKELDLGKNEVNLSQLIQESVDKSLEGTQLRQWDFTFNLSGKAKGGELVLTMRFQIMEKDGGIGIYRQAEAIKTGGGGHNKNPSSSSAFARKQSKASFSIPSPRLTARAGPPRTPSKPHSDRHLQGIDDLNLDEPAPPSSVSSARQKKVEEDIDIDVDPPEFEIVDKGVEISKKERGDDDESDQGRAAEEDKSTSSEVVKEVLLEQIHMTRLTELDSIAQQIKALESMMVERKVWMKDEDTESQRLDAEEENVTREFLQMLEDEDELNEFQLDQQHNYLLPQIQPDHHQNCDVAECDTKVYLSDLGKGLGCVVQTRDGGYLAAMNPLDAAVARKDTPKLAMQISKPMVLASSSNNSLISGFEVFQKMAAMGIEGLRSQISSHLPPMDELMGKTAEQIAFEGIASAIIQGRKREEGGGGASSSAARTVAMVKTMGTALNAGRKERISTGIWSTANDNPVTVDEILAFSLQKIEAMAVEALKIQAEISEEEEAPFQVSWHNGKAVGKGENNQQPLMASAIPLEDWIRDQQRESETVTLVVVVVQLRDPVRRYEAVGGPVLALIHATTHDDDGEKRYKVTSLHAGGLKVNERQRLTAMQWLVAYGLGKAAAGKKLGKQGGLSKGQDVFWSMSSRVMADMWLKPIRNPDIKFAT